jgi:ribonuclease P protein component
VVNKAVGNAVLRNRVHRRLRALRRRTTTWSRTSTAH